MNRRAFLGVLGLAAAPVTALAQTPGRPPRLGVLWPGTVPRYDDAFRQGLRELGYIEGKNIVVEYRATQNDMSRAPRLAAELVGLNVDIIFAAVAPEAKAADEAARKAGRTIPIIFGPVGDPVENGLVASLAVPGGQMTGLHLQDPEFEAKQLQLLKEALPRMTRLAWLEATGLTNPRYAARVSQALNVAAKALGIERGALTVNTPRELDAALTQVTRTRFDAAMVTITPVTLTARRRIIDAMARIGLPAMYGDALFVEDGGLLFYGVSFESFFRYAATYVDKILKGAKPATLPVERPTKIELVINRRTATTLKLTIPPALLARANRLIE